MVARALATCVERRQRAELAPRWPLAAGHRVAPLAAWAPRHTAQNAIQGPRALRAAAAARLWSFCQGVPASRPHRAMSALTSVTSTPIAAAASRVGPVFRGYLRTSTPNGARLGPGSRGSACRRRRGSADASRAPLPASRAGRELAWFPAATRSRARPVATLAYSEWFWSATDPPGTTARDASELRAPSEAPPIHPVASGSLPATEADIEAARRLLRRDGGQPPKRGDRIRQDAVAVIRSLPAKTGNTTSDRM